MLVRYRLPPVELASEGKSKSDDFEEARLYVPSTTALCCKQHKRKLRNLLSEATSIESAKISSKLKNYSVEIAQGVRCMR